ncbi:MAG: hypothetical protein ACOYOV_00425 [Bacteroidales bacterium]
MSTIQDKLLPLIENVDYSIQNDELVALPKKRMVPQIIHHEAVAEVLGEVMENVNGLFKLNKSAVIVAASPAHDETILVEEEYKEMLPDLESVKMSCIDDLALAISEFLADKQDLVDHENDSINIVDGNLHSFNFKNIPMPKASVLLACYEKAVARNSQAEINAAALKYLQETDFHVTKAAELGTPILPSILAARAEARAKIIK